MQKQEIPTDFHPIVDISVVTFILNVITLINNDEHLLHSNIDRIIRIIHINCVQGIIIIFYSVTYILLFCMNYH